MLQHLLGSELFLKAQTDERLVALCREGHTRAFGVLVDRHRRALLGHAARLVGPERGEDVLQQGLLNAWRFLQDGAEIRYTQAWLHRIVHNAALTEIERQPRNTEPLDLDLDVAGPVTTASAAEQRDELRQMLHGLAGLPDRERLALLGSELDGRSRRQLADELGLSEGAVRQLVYRARQRMRAGLAVLIPFPLLLRAGRAWAHAADAADHLPGPVQAAGGSGLVIGGVKAATVTIVVGAIGGAAVLHVGGGHPARPAPSAHAVSAASARRATADARSALPPASLSAPIRPTDHRPAHAARSAPPRRPPAAPTATPPAASTATGATRAPLPARPTPSTEAEAAPTLRSPTPTVITAPRRTEQPTTAEADSGGAGAPTSDITSSAASSDGAAATSDSSTITAPAPVSTTPTITAPTADATTTDTTSATSSPTSTSPTSTTGSTDG